jgi:transposase InsO family protein
MSQASSAALQADEKADTVTAFFQRALADFAARGIAVRRVMTDGAWSYTRNRDLRELLSAHTIRHIVTPPYTPRWNGKVERFHQTMEREWAKGLRYRNSSARNEAPATLADALQRAQAPLSPQRPATHQPRLQRLWAGQLDARLARVQPVAEPVDTEVGRNRRHLDPRQRDPSCAHERSAPL